MHEMAIAESILTALVEHGRAQDYKRVTLVRLEIGPLAGVEIEALRFCFDVVIKGSLADGARLEIISDPAQAWCMTCGKTVAIAERYDPCPGCGGHQLQITSGTELRIKDLEVE